MPNYQRGKVYKIVCNITKEEYVGSTTEPTLARRLSGHNRAYKLWLKDNSQTYVSSFRILERGNYKIVLLESYPCNNKDELRARERYWFDTIQNINMIRPIRTEEEENEYQKEYREKHKEEQKEYINEYYKQNKEQAKEQAREYYHQHKEYYKKQNKKYREQNKDKIKEQKKEYYKQNTQLFTCDCGLIIQINSKSRHCKSQRHLLYLDNQVSTPLTEPLE
jgi:hypothetical protein